MTATAEPRRSRPRLSPIRVAIAFLAVAAVTAIACQLTLQVIEAKADDDGRWFAPYVDVTLPPYWNFQDPTQNPSKDVVLSFVVADPDDACAPTWGAAYDLDAAAGELDLDRRIVRYRERGGDVIVSFGGVANDELATVCTDHDDLVAAYAEVVDRYDLAAIDLDVEGAALGDPAVAERRATAIAEVQADATADGGRLDVWLTLPMAPTGLTEAGVAELDAMLEAGVDVAGVNVMAMEYGASRPAGTSFVDASISGIDATATQVTEAYARQGVVLTEPQAYAKVGVTPMIGQNYSPDDRLDIEGAQELHDRASGRGVKRFSMWSLNRDAPCGGNVDPAISNTNCSGVEQEPLEFSEVFASDGRATDNAAIAAQQAQAGRSRVTDRAVTVEGTGPYADWRPRREYDLAAKVVWRGQVYEAKWWNVGAQPDAPVEHEWDSPWRILGPVLPDDPPPPSPPTVPEGTYPAWEQKATYDTGDRVEHLGVGYRAKWWTRGDDPSMDVDNEWENPWEVVGPPAGDAPATDDDAS